ncbi:hypothetical protein CROQUDRAFT_95250 [Cronartium quercuum f. sp. fusiforme G11]|uniref:Uncharacterized protein n=1 Tax=Cronartium quercuum f. sp. fusiforme G11 TaxID=708437 RepID=A0A9P6TB43_9BASI|nr:hypothetical protein CROQUDRAFT_95250 [Cronartium quercuum f. sp. fusiforme G11]
MTTASDSSTPPRLPSLRTRKPSTSDALQLPVFHLQSFDLRDNLKERFARVPCQRKALLFGLVGGSAIGILRMIITRRGRPSAITPLHSSPRMGSQTYPMKLALLTLLRPRKNESNERERKHQLGVGPGGFGDLVSAAQKVIAQSAV